MATNIQWILYKNTDGKILVKVLFNEQEIKLPIDSEYAPYYDWELFQKYCEKQTNTLFVIVVVLRYNMVRKR